MNLRKKLNNKVFKNSIWMMSEKVVSIFGLIFVTSFVAKYIGPENFGKLTFATAIFAIIQTAAMFGSENILFKKSSQNRVIGEKIIKATIPIRNAIYIFFSSSLLVFIFLYTDRLTFIFSIASFVAIYFSLHDVYSIYFNAILNSKINTLCNIFALLLSLFIRYIIAKFQLAIEWLCLPIILLSLIPFLLRRRIYSKIRKSNKKTINFKINRYRQYMVKVGGKLVLYTLSVAIFTKSAQMFLGMKSQYELGIYTVAVTLGTSFYFVLTALISSYMTQIYIEPNFEISQKMVAKLNLMIIIISVFAFIFFAIFGGAIVYYLYGSEFKEVNDILLLMVIVCFFSGISTVSEKYLIKFKAFDYLKVKTNFLVVFNIGLTCFLIFFYGLYGAVYSILITEILSATLFNYFYQKGLILDTHKRVFSLSTYSMY
ncbi:MATE family efflux transporter [Acinetobacter kanungonis]|uniref:oligosaccharide flippase family protein n=1 Tax=Acinetobacter kanungonis TaxID=2699469 RepID=UPI00137A9271|nr:oligosaccharide flippase family protein [Acinetobacter kanungonis]NCI79692.1 oligosaccharide flippase family protein [Acinetobacter kanungonis]